MAKITNKRHKAFADQYILNGGNATDAYAKVYPKATPDTARARGSMLLSKDNIRSYVDKRLDKIEEKVELSQEKIFELMADIITGKETDEVINVVGEGVGYSKTTKDNIKINANTRLRAMREYLLFKEKLSDSGGVNITINNDLPYDDEE